MAHTINSGTLANLDIPLAVIHQRGGLDVQVEPQVMFLISIEI